MYFTSSTEPEWGSGDQRAWRGRCCCRSCTFVLWKIRTLGEGLKITTKRTIDHHGLFSKDTSDVLHVDIKNIQIKQSFPGPGLERGRDCPFELGGARGRNPHQKRVPNPEKVRQVIDLYRQL